MTKQPINPITTAGWYEHTDGTIGYYSWQGGGGALYTALDICVPDWPTAISAPSSAQLHKRMSDARAVADRETATWCELALQGHEFARVQCLRMHMAEGAQ